MKKPSFSLIIILTAICTSSAFGNTVNVQSLNKSLQKQNATWIAKDNWLNQLPRQELIRMMGVKEAPNADIQFAIPVKLQSSQALPTSHDWRDYNNQNWVSPILNQANCGSCVAFAAIGVFETQMNISSLIPSLNRKMSTQFLFSCGGGACDYGWQPNSAASFLMKTGATDEACMPYSSGATGNDVSCKSACSNAKTRTQKIANYQMPSRGSQNIASVKQALLKGPVMTTLTVYADFISYSSGVYKRTSSDALGGHAISIVGFDDQTRSWIIRNSWGQDWGENGFAHISYDDDSGVSQNSWLFNVPAMGGYVFTQTPRDYDYVSGDIPVAGTSNLDKTSSVKSTIYSGNNVIWEDSCAKADCNFTTDSKKLADGRYEVVTTALDTSGNSIGQSDRNFFYVANSEPHMSVSFSGVDVTQPLKGRVVFNVSAKSSSVPFSSLELHIKNLNTGTEIIKHSQIVLDSTTVGWRTPAVANGPYEIYFVGKITAGKNNFTTESEHVKINVKN